MRQDFVPPNIAKSVLIYTHNGDNATSDVFEVEDMDLFWFQVQVTITPPSSPIVVAPTALPTLTAGVPFSQTLTASGGTAPYTYALQSGTLPVGLTLSSAGVLSGTPTQRGIYSFTVRVTGTGGQFIDKSYSGTVQVPSLALASASSTAIQGAPFSVTLATNGGVAPYSYLLETGTLPAGLTLSAAGVISGTTTAAAGNYPVTIRVTDSSTGPGSYFELENYTVTVSSAPSVSIAVSPGSVSEDGATNLVYTVTRSANLTSPTTVNITTAGTATAGTDFGGSASSVTIPAGATTATITIDPVVDGSVEPDETVTLIVAAGTGYTVGAPSSAVGTILNDDVPTASISVSPASVAEDGAPNLVYTVTLNQAAFNPVQINFTLGGTATSGTDYAAVASPLLINTGNTSATITINPTADAAIESDETVAVTLAAGTGYSVGAPGTAVGTILNDDLPSLSINDITAAEGNSGSTNFTFTVALSAPAGPGGVSFDIATANGTATAGTDYTATSLTAQTIPAGSSTYTFTVPVSGDAANEPNETFFVNVTNVTGSVVVDGQGVGTITNDDPLPSVSAGNVTVLEGNSGTTNAVVTVTLSAPSGQTISVQYATADGTASQPADYTATAGTLTFTPGQTTRTVTIPVVGEAVPEANEVFTLGLSGAVNATIAAPTATITITNDDVPVTVSPGALPGGTAGTLYSQTLSASGGSGPYTFAVTAGVLPTGLSLPSSGVLSGLPTVPGTFNFSVTATDSSAAPGPFAGTQSYSVTIAAPTIALAPKVLPTGTAGTAYADAIPAASGGTAPYGYAVTAGALPTGLSLNPTSGAITGTPTAPGTFNFTVAATDASVAPGPYSGTQNYAITINAPTIVLPPKALGGATAGSVYSDGVGPASGGVAPYSYAVTAGALPPGMNLTASSGAISGTPSAAGVFNFTITASDGSPAPGPFTASQSYAITVALPSITLTSKALVNGITGTAYNDAIPAASGGIAPYAYAVTAGTLPTGLTLNSGTGAITGIPAAAGTFNFTVTASDSTGGTGPATAVQSFTITVNAAPIASNSALTLGYNAPATAVPLSLSGGAPTALAITVPPAHGTAAVSGTSITYQPAAGYAGSDNFSYTASNIAGTSAPASVAVTVGGPTITASASGGFSAAVGTAYSNTITWSGGAAPYSGLAATGLPAGLAITATSPTSVTVSGTPTQAGTFALTFSATDASTGTGPFTVSQNFTLAVAAPVLTLAPASGTLTAPYGTPFSQAFTASGGSGTFSYAETGALPAGIAFAGNTLSGSPTAPGSYAITVTATDTVTTGVGAPFRVTQTYTLNVPAPTVAINPATLPAASAATPYSQQLAAGGGVGPYGWTVSAGTLPAGLTLSTGGLLSGTPTASGAFAFTVRAQDANGQAGTRAYTLNVSAPALTITPATLPAATMGVAFNQTISASGGIAPYSYAVTAGALPTGLTLNTATGAISGTPTVSGNYAVTITATDSTAGTRGTGAITYTLAVTARPDPASDPEVRGLNSAQVAISRRFAETQVENFSQRLSDLHHAGSGGFKNSLRLAQTSSLCLDAQIARSNPACSPDGRGPALNVGDTDGSDRKADGAERETLTGVWTAGTIRFGGRDAANGRLSYDFLSQGISFGIDHRFGESLAGGVGFGFGHERQDVGDNGSGITASAKSAVLYASHRLAPEVFVDWLAGYQWIDFGIKRFVPATSLIVTSDRGGHQWFASISAVADLDRDSWRLAPYLRLDLTRGALGAYTETSGTLWDLKYLSQTVNYTSLSLGARYQRHFRFDGGRFSPQLRFEYQRDLERNGVARVAYADQLSSQFSTITLNGFARDRVLVAIGGELVLVPGWAIDAEYGYRTGSDSLGDNSVRLGLKLQF